MEKIYGIYPGNQNPEEINNCSEAELFFKIEYLEMSIWYSTEYTYSLFSQKEVDEILNDLYYGLDYLLYQTTRFGVEFPEPTPGYRVEKNEYYKAWYEFNRNYFNTILTDEEYIEATLHGPNPSMPLPTENWKNNLPSELKMDMNHFEILL